METNLNKYIKLRKNILNLIPEIILLHRGYNSSRTSRIGHIRIALITNRREKKIIVQVISKLITSITQFLFNVRQFVLENPHY